MYNGNEIIMNRTSLSPNLAGESPRGRFPHVLGETVRLIYSANSVSLRSAKKKTRGMIP
jgi:hypothetical protein